MTKDLLKASEVAQRLGIGVRTVWKWTALGELPAPFRLGRITRWRRRDIHRYLAARRGRAPRRPA